LVSGKIALEWVVKLDGKVRRRPAGTENLELHRRVELYVIRSKYLEHR